MYYTEQAGGFHGQEAERRDNYDLSVGAKDTTTVVLARLELNYSVKR